MQYFKNQRQAKRLFEKLRKLQTGTHEDHLGEVYNRVGVLVNTNDEAKALFVDMQQILQQDNILEVDIVEKTIRFYDSWVKPNYYNFTFKLRISHRERDLSDYQIVKGK
jgi:hypothetical protein